MTAELVKEWKINAILLHDSAKIYMDIIDNILKSDVELFRDIAKITKYINKIPKGEILFNTTKNLFVNIDIVNTITSALEQLVTLITKSEYLKRIKNEMSDTYYKTITTRGDKLVRDVNSLNELAVRLSKSAIDNIDDEVVKGTSISEFEKLYLSHLSSASSIIFKHYMNIYRKINTNTQPLLQKIYDYVLGYKDEKLNRNMYSSHPLLLMGLSFSLTPHTDFISTSVVDKVTSGGIIKINNKISHALSYTTYDIQALLHGKYTTVNRKESINPNTIIYSKTIQSTPLLTSSKGSYIEEINVNNSALTTVYESLDGSTQFRKIGETTPSDAIKYINKGPKPRVYLYNSNCIDVLTSKTQTKLPTPVVKSKVEYVDATKLTKNKTLSSMYKELAHSSNDKNRERRLYNIIKANTYLKEIKKINTKYVETILIPFNQSSIYNLF